MFLGNDTRAVIRTLSRRSFKASRARNLAAVLAIVLTAFLFTSVITLSVGTLEATRQMMFLQKGNAADGEMRYLTKEQFEQMKESSILKRAGERVYLGYLTNSGRHNIELNYMDQIQQELSFSQPAHGSAPEKANEIMTSDAALQAMGIPPEIGVKAPVELTVRGIPYHFDMVLSGWWPSANSQISTMVVSEAFMKEQAALFPNTFSKDREMAGTWISYLELKDEKNVHTQLEQLAVTLGGNPQDSQASNYIQCSENVIGGAAGSMLPAFAAIGGFLILFTLCCYLLIYNIFDISVMKDIRQYGLLRTIGASSRQIRAVVRKQALLLTMAGLPLGLFAGFLAGRLCLPVVMSFFAHETLPTALTVSPHPAIFAAAAGLSAFNVWIGTHKPARKASGVSPIEAIHFTETAPKKQARKSHCGRFSLFHMAWANLSRSQGRSVRIVLSMILCMLMLNSAVLLSGSLDSEKFVRTLNKTDFLLANANTFQITKGFTSRADGLSSDALAFAEGLSGTEDFGYLYKNTLDDQDVSFDYGYSGLQIVEQIKGAPGILETAYDNGFRMNLSESSSFPIGNVYGMSDGFLSRLTVYEGETDPEILKEKMAGGGIIVGVPVLRDTGGPLELWVDQQLKVGQTIMAYTGNETAKTFTVIAKAVMTMSEMESDSHTNGKAKVGGDAPLLYMTEDSFRELYPSPTLLSCSFNSLETKHADVTAALEDYLAHNPDVAMGSADLLRNQLHSISTIIMLVGGFISAIFAMAGLLNFANMMITSIMTRRHEFAAMQSIGMTGRQLCRLMIWEGLCYAFLSGVLGILSCELLSATLLRGVCGLPFMWYFTYHLTLLPALAITGAYLLIALFLPPVVLKFFHYGSIVERLRMAE